MSGSPARMRRVSVPRRRSTPRARSSTARSSTSGRRVRIRPACRCASRPAPVDGRTCASRSAATSRRRRRGWPRCGRRHRRLRPRLRRMPIYGPLSLRIGKGEVRIKDVTVTDLLRPAAGVAAEVDFAELPADSAHRSLLLRRHLGRRHQPRRRHGRAHRAVCVSRSGLQALGRDLPAADLRDRQCDDGRAVHGQLPELRPRLQRRRLERLPEDQFQRRLSLRQSEGRVALLADAPGHRGGVSSETTQLGDIDGDGKVELLDVDCQRRQSRDRLLRSRERIRPSSGRSLQSRTRGTGAATATAIGDINGDGRNDIIQGSGWWEQPAAGATSGLWKFNAVPFGRGDRSVHSRRRHVRLRRQRRQAPGRRHQPVRARSGSRLVRAAAERAGSDHVEDAHDHGSPRCAARRAQDVGDVGQVRGLHRAARHRARGYGWRRRARTS